MQAFIDETVKGFHWTVTLGGETLMGTRPTWDEALTAINEARARLMSPD